MSAAGEMSVNQTWFWHHCSTEVDRGQNSECCPLDLLFKIDTCICKHISNSSCFNSYVISTHTHTHTPVFCVRLQHLFISFLSWTLHHFTTRGMESPSRPVIGFSHEHKSCGPVALFLTNQKKSSSNGAVLRGQTPVRSPAGRRGDWHCRCHSFGRWSS